MKEGRDIAAEDLLVGMSATYDNPPQTREEIRKHMAALRKTQECERWDGTCPTCGQPNRTGEVTIDRAVLAEALEQIKAAEYEWIQDEKVCFACGAAERPALDLTHAPGCRFVRVTEALEKLVGK